VYVIVGLHKILPERLPDYLENVRLHARNSRSEPGCVRYDVLQDEDDPTMICLFEVFEDEAAFQAHRAAEHYKRWMELSRDWRDGGVRERHVMRYVSPETPPRQA
jgi:autoinducer 2-degrading protein